MRAGNKCEIRVAGLQRSGNHAIINWIIGLCQGRLCFLNKAEPLENPYLTHKERILKNLTDEDFSSDQKGSFVQKDYLIYSYEDCPLEKVFDAEFEKGHDRYVGKSSKRFDVIILRDAFNYFASRIKLEEFGILGQSIYLTNEKSKKLLMDMWKDYAREHLGETDYAGKWNKVAISYNRWCFDREYRRLLAGKLGLEFRNEDAASRRVAKYGPGSSFDKLSYDGRAEQMRVLERWREFKDNPFYRDIFRDRELAELSEKIFGKIEGTQVLMRDLSLAKRISNNLKFKAILLKGKSRLYLKRILKHGKKH